MTDEMKKAIADAVAEATATLKAEHDEAVKGLKTKNAELIAREKKAKEDADAATAAAEEAAEATKLASTNIDDVRTTLEAKHKRELEKLTKERDEAVTGRNKLLIDNQIAADLVALDVSKPFHGMLTRALKAQAEVKGDVAMIDGLPLSDYIKDYLGGDEGKHYVNAPANSGGGATGTTKVVEGHGFTKENFAQKEGEWAKLAMTEPAKAKIIATEVGRNDLANSL